MPHVVTVGAGPAALAAAIGCARAGLRVTIVADRRGERSGRAPSETLHPGVESLLRELGAEHVLATASRGTYGGIWRDGVFTPLGSDQHGPWVGHHVDRTRLDAALLAHAVACGAVSATGRVLDVIRAAERIAGVSTSAGDLSADYVVDGSGRHRVLGRRLGFAEIVSSPPMIAWSALIDPLRRGGEPRFEAKSDGWSWVAPEASGLATWTRLTVSAGPHVVRPPMEDGVLAGKLVGTNVRWRVFRPLVKEGLLLTGDAAGMIDPGGGQGMFRALLAGIMAGRTVVEAVARPVAAAFALARYDAWFLEQHDLQMHRLRPHYPF